MKVDIISSWKTLNVHLQYCTLFSEIFQRFKEKLQLRKQSGSSTLECDTKPIQFLQYKKGDTELSKFNKHQLMFTESMLWLNKMNGQKSSSIPIYLNI